MTIILKDVLEPETTASTKTSEVRKKKKTKKHGGEATSTWESEDFFS